MKKIMFAVLAALLCAVVVSGCTSSKQSPEEIAKSLSNNLTDDMDINGGTRAQGAPPDTTSGAPLVTNIDSMPTLFTGKAFEVTLYTDYLTPMNIEGAYLYVVKAVEGVDGGGKTVGADQHTVVKVSSQEGGRFTLTGNLGKNDRLSGERFTIRLGLFDPKGVGNYYDWNVAVESGSCSDGGICKPYCTKSIGCGSEETMEKCMANCALTAPMYLATLQTRMMPCASVEVCEEARSCWTLSFDDCPLENYEAKHAYCAKNKECDPAIDLQLCYETEGAKPRWTDTNCMCIQSVANYVSCLNGIVCSEFLKTFDQPCASLVPSSPRSQQP
ncbi:MAG: hypothetical protein WC889_08270 [Myxococcota bacterium]|jgi:hypothetical protein